MVAAIKDQRRFWIFMPLAWFLAILQIFSMEYFVGLELLRPLLVWQLTRTQAGSLRLSLAKVMKIWFPYLLFLVMFAIWRVLIFPSITDPASLSVPTILVMMKANPLNGLIELVEVAVRDLLYLASGVWLEPLSPDSVVLRSSAYLASLALGLLAALIAFILPGIRDTEPPPAFQEGSGRSFLQLAMPFSLLALIGGGLPVWLTGRVITEGAWSDRFALGPMIGSVVFLVCLVEWLGGPKVLRKAILLSFLVGIASAYQFQIARNFRTHWDLQRDYYWQLGWRAPALQHGTAVVMPSLPFSYVAEYSMGFALNTLYGPGFSGDLATVWFINGFRAQGSRQLPALEPGYPIEDSFRNVVFRGDTSNTIVIAYNKARGCLRVLDGVYQLAPPIEKEDLLLKIANTDLILPGSDTPTPARIFGPEPDHTWCYYFQKADLARQTGDWVEALQLAEQVESLNLSPVNPVEWLPFIEAYAHAGRWQDSHQWINLAVSQKPDLIPFYCDAWSRLQQEAPPSEQQLPEVEALKQSLNCPLTRE
jgi:hypothetical protein